MFKILKKKKMESIDALIASAMLVQLQEEVSRNSWNSVFYK